MLNIGSWLNWINKLCYSEFIISAGGTSHDLFGCLITAVLPFVHLQLMKSLYASYRNRHGFVHSQPLTC